MPLNATGLSDVGLTRSHNEDSYHVDVDRGLLLVADGMGGHGHGDMASRLAVQAIVDHVGDLTTDLDSEDADSDSSPADDLSAAVRSAHRRVVGAVEDDQTLLGMGTTVVSLLVTEGLATVAYVGDSRVYLLRNGQLDLVTDDHTWVNEQVKAGYLTLEQARTHPLKSVVTRAVGGDHEVEVDVIEVATQDNDLFLLCSDGLTSMLDDNEIREHLVRTQDLETSCQGLIDDANQHGGVDNVTVVLFRAAG